MKAQFDQAIGRVPMHSLTVVWLAIIALAAVVLSIVGELFYTPLQLLLSLLVLLVTAIGVNWLIALCLRRRPHTPSAVITGLLLFFLFWPVAEPAGLAVLALAAAIAIVSKYLIAIRGRHLFNPAAFGALVIGFTGLTASVWWVATPWLLPFVAIGGFLVLYRTRGLLVGALFVVLAAGIVTARLVIGGSDPLGAIAVVLTSYPIVFLAGFMLSEPLTLPPRRWQQLGIAAVAAVLFSVPFSVGPVFSTPELALVLANLVAAVFIGGAGLRLIFRGRTQVARNVVEFQFDAARPLRLLPGQYLEVELPHRADRRGSRRSFSVIISPDEAGRARRVAFGVRVAEPASSFKRALMALQPGDRLRGTWVGGDFVAPRRPRPPQLLVAGGIGITPFITELRGNARGVQGQADTVLVYSVTSREDAGYLDVLADCGIPVLLAVTSSADAGTDAGTDQVGPFIILPPGRITPESLSAVPDLRSRHARVSGSPEFVAGMKRTLHKAGVRHIRTDVFAGY